MTPEDFGAAVALLMKDPTAYKRASRRDLVFLEGMLTVIVDAIKGELDARDGEKING